MQLRAWITIAATLMAAGCGSSSPSPPLEWRFSCGDPVCRGHGPDPAVPSCVSQQPGAACTAEGARCDPGDECNRRLVCSSEDPALAPGGCPISVAAAKADIAHISPAQARAYRDELVAIRLATWRYRSDQAGVTRLGFVIDDGVPGLALTPDAGHVDLYGYTSLAVAALQEQQREIEGLKAEVAALRAMIARDVRGTTLPGR
jgi:hypothetical protein